MQRWLFNSKVNDSLDPTLLHHVIKLYLLLHRFDCLNMIMLKGSM